MTAVTAERIQRCMDTRHNVNYLSLKVTFNFAEKNRW